jgi:hypothetical protein
MDSVTQTTIAPDWVVAKPIISSPLGLLAIGFSEVDYTDLRSHLDDCGKTQSDTWSIKNAGQFGSAIINCDSEFGWAFVCKLIEQNRQQLRYCILLAHSYSRVNELGVTAEDHCLIIAPRLRTCSLAHCLNALLPRVNDPRYKGSFRATESQKPFLKSPIAIAPLELDNLIDVSLSLIRFPSVKLISKDRRHVSLAAQLFSKKSSYSELMNISRMASNELLDFLNLMRSENLLLITNVGNKVAVAPSPMPTLTLNKTTSNGLSNGSSSVTQAAKAGIFSLLRAKFKRVLA